MRVCEKEDELEVVNAGVTNMAMADQIAEMSANHAQRISAGTCSSGVGATTLIDGDGVGLVVACSSSAGASCLALVNDVQRAGVHFYNVAKSVRGL